MYESTYYVWFNKVRNSMFSIEYIVVVSYQITISNPYVEPRIDLPLTTAKRNKTGIGDHCQGKTSCWPTLTLA